MISAKVKITQVYRNEGSDTCIKAKVITSEHSLKTHPQYKTVSVYGDFPNFIEKYSKYIITISDHASDKGHYKLIQMGRLPRRETIENLNNLVMEHPNCKWSDEEYYQITNAVEHLYAEESKIVLKALKGLDLKENESDFLAKRNGLVRELKKIYSTALEIVEFREKLTDIGIIDENTHYKIIKNIKGDKKEAIKALKENPYLLIDAAEMTLPAVDEIALAIGVKADDDNRITAITEMNLRNLGAEGKTWLYKETYLACCDELYPYDTSNYSFNRDYLRKKINQLGDRTGFYVNIDENRIASSKYYLLEQELFQIIKRLCTNNTLEINSSRIQQAIVDCEHKNKIQLLNEQKKAVYNSFKSDFSIIAGAAGTGKTTIAKAVANVYSNVVVSALSGKATLRISETTCVTGENSRTMHSFSNIDKPYINADLVIVDECSMIGLDIAIDFFRKIRPGTHVMILGDHCQLSPIGAGNMFFDLIHSHFMNVSVIEEVHRQALDSNIIKFATDVRHQIYNVEYLKSNKYNDFEMYLLNDNREIANKAIKVFNSHFNKYNIEDIMLVSPTKNAAYVLNNTIQNILKEQGIVKDEIIELETPWDPSLKFKLRVGDRVINIENYHKCPSNEEGTTVAVMNGSLGTFVGKKKIKNKKGEVVKTVFEFDFDGVGVGWYSKNDLKRILLGYCITVHKSQGSQADLLIYIHPERCHDRLNCSEMVYTAVTRAKEKAVVISTEAVLERAITTKELNSKQTLLREFLDAGCIQEDLHIEENKSSEKTSLEVVQEAAVDTDLKPFIEKEEKKEKPSKKTKIIDSKTRAKYDKNNAQKRAKRRNEAGLLAKEQAKQDKINLIKKLYVEGKTQKEIVEITGFAKGTVSRYLRL